MKKGKPKIKYQILGDILLIRELYKPLSSTQIMMEVSELGLEIYDFKIVLIKDSYRGIDRNPGLWFLLNRNGCVNLATRDAIRAIEIVKNTWIC